MIWNEIKGKSLREYDFETQGQHQQRLRFSFDETNFEYLVDTSNGHEKQKLGSIIKLGNVNFYQ